jgi:hypothetical protein
MAPVRTAARSYPQRGLDGHATCTPRDAAASHSASALYDIQTIATALISSAVIPALLQKHKLAQRRAVSSSFHPAITRLVPLLIAADPGGAFDLIDAEHARDDSLARMASRLFEPAARSLGDLCIAGGCTDFEVTLGLSRLQTAVRRMSARSLSQPLAGLPQRAVLIAPPPGESHILGAVLDFEVLWRAGWDTHLEHPASDLALQAMVARKHFDALDLCLSGAIHRGAWLPRVTRTIALARRASCNPRLTVVVGGRVFDQQPAAAIQIGADICCATSAQVVSLLAQAAGLTISADLGSSPQLAQSRTARGNSAGRTSPVPDYLATAEQRRSQIPL